jgi:hypothetical protein
LPLRTFLVGLALIWPASSLAWDGVDSETGASVEIGKGNLVRRGQTIEIYDSNTGTYKDVEVNSIDQNGGSVDVEVYDSETGETRVLEMDQ